MRYTRLLLNKELDKMHNGLEIFFVEPGTVETMTCRVCGTTCAVQRDAYGPTSLAMAMAKNKKQHDVFTCPHAGEDWHEQALALIQAIEATPSKRVAELMRLDLQELLAEQELEL